MREIRCRVYDNDSKQFIKFGLDTRTDFLSDIDAKARLRSARIVYELNTGMKDKNGQDIYDGDIIKEKLESGETMISRVAFENNTWKLLGSQMSQQFFNEPIVVDDCEVIGNIHQHSALLV